MKNIYYKTGYKYQLAEDYGMETNIILAQETGRISIPFVGLWERGALHIKAGYAWDGPSGPAIDTKNFMRGSLVHDALYQLMREENIDPGIYRDQADRLLQQMFIEDSLIIINRSSAPSILKKIRIATMRLRAWWIYKSLALFARSASDPENQKPVITAPWG